MSEPADDSPEIDQDAGDAEQGVAAAGRRLREAREARGLGAEEVGLRLRLDSRLILALETGDEGRLPAMTYVTGYVRAYARLVGLDEDQLVALAGSSTAPRDELLPENVDLGTSGGGVSRGAWVGGVLFLLVVIGLVLWWLRDTPATPPPAAEPAPTAQPAPAVVSPPASAPTSPGVEAVPAVPPATATTEVPAAAPAAGPQPENVPQSSDVAPVSGPPVPLEFRFSDDSWVEVRDATGAQLAYAMMEAGSELEVQGIPPFEVLLGYAPGVAITYNGQPFDTAPFIRGDVARLRIGAATP